MKLPRHTWGNSIAYLKFNISLPYVCSSTHSDTYASKC